MITSTFYPDTSLFVSHHLDLRSFPVGSGFLNVVVRKERFHLLAEHNAVYNSIILWQHFG